MRFDEKNGDLKRAGGGGGDDADGVDLGARRATPQDDVARTGKTSSEIRESLASEAVGGDCKGRDAKRPKLGGLQAAAGARK